MAEGRRGGVGRKVAVRSRSCLSSSTLTDEFQAGAWLIGPRPCRGVVPASDRRLGGVSTCATLCVCRCPGLSGVVGDVGNTVLNPKSDVRCLRSVFTGSLPGTGMDGRPLSRGVSGSAPPPFNFLAIFRSGDMDRDRARVLFEAPREEPGVSRWPFLAETAVLPEALEPPSLGVVSPRSRYARPLSISASVRASRA
jgi:hypothetical protein